MGNPFYTIGHSTRPLEEFTGLLTSADVTLVVPPITDGFHDELVHTSRAALVLLVEQVVELLVAHRGERGRAARAAALSVLGDGLQD